MTAPRIFVLPLCCSVAAAAASVVSTGIERALLREVSGGPVQQELMQSFRNAAMYDVLEGCTAAFRRRSC